MDKNLQENMPIYMQIMNNVFQTVSATFIYIPKKQST